MLAPNSPHDALFKNCQRIGSIGPIVAAIASFSFGWARGYDVINSSLQAVGFALASLFVGYGLVLVCFAWRENKRALAGLFLTLFSISVVAEGMAHLGVISSNSAKATASATVSKAKFTAVNQERDAAQADVDRLAREVGSPLAMSKAQAEAKIRETQAHRWWGTTNQCNEPKGPQTRAFCAEFFAAQAASTDADARVGKEKALAAARERLDSKSAGTGGVKIETAVADAQALALAQVGFWTLTPTSDQTAQANIIAALVLTAVFVSFGVLNAALYELRAGGDVGQGVVRVANDDAVSASDPASVLRTSPHFVRVSQAPDTQAIKVLSGLLQRRGNVIGQSKAA